jgi:alpha-tubulin suppressor-like RCC1 family protein
MRSIEHQEDFHYSKVVAGFESNVTCVSSGDNHTVAVTGKGEVFSIGHGDDYSSGGHTHNYTTYTFMIIEPLSDVFIISVAAGDRFTLALSRDGNVYSFGSNSHQQLGINDEDTIMGPTRINDLNDIKCVAAGANHSLAVNYKGRVFSFGCSEGGECGRDETNYKPTIIESLYAICDVAAGNKHSLFLSLTGEVYSCGRNDYGQLGYSTDIVTQNVPRLVTDLRRRVSKIVAGGEHSLALSNGDLYSFGSNTRGQLGREAQFHELSENTYFPTKVENPYKSIRYIEEERRYDIINMVAHDDKTFVLFRKTSTGPIWRETDKELGEYVDITTIFDKLQRQKNKNDLYSMVNLYNYQKSFFKRIRRREIGVPR